MFAHITLLHINATNDLLLALAMCIVPFILGWLAAYAYYKVGNLRARVADLEKQNAELTAKVDGLNNDLTDARVRITQLEAELMDKSETLRTVRNQLVICEADLNVLKYKMAEKEGNGAGTGEQGRGIEGEETPVVAFNEDIPFAGGKFKRDDLEIVEGIGPAIAALLREAGIANWKQLSETPAERLREILDAAGPRYNIHDPSTWAEQARMADANEWAALEKYQGELKGGRVA